MRRLPPLNPLRAFEAAARHESFNRAGEELHVTASAVSHQVRTLEEYLGVTLFHRHPRAVSLTAAGRDFLPPIEDALDRIGLAAERMSRAAADNVLTVSAAPAFAMGWLIPRLIDFQAQRPDIEVRLDTSVTLVDFTRSDVDVAIRHTLNPAGDGLHTHCLFLEELVIACAPVLAGKLRKPEDLPGHTLLHSQTRMGAWRAWASSVGLEELDAVRGPRLANDTMALEAAVSGLGVAIIQRHVAERTIAEGRLVVPFESDYRTSCGYHLVYPASAAERSRVAAFRDWLLAAVEAESAADIPEADALTPAPSRA